MYCAIRFPAYCDCDALGFCCFTACGLGVMGARLGLLWYVVWGSLAWLVFNLRVAPVGGLFLSVLLCMGAWIYWILIFGLLNDVLLM